MHRSESKRRTKKKEKRGCVPEQRCVPERGEGEGTSQSNVGERASQRVVQKGGGGVVSQKKGNGEARDDLESFVATVRAWELPQKCHVTYS